MSTASVESVDRRSVITRVVSVVAGMLISAVVAHFHQVRVAPGTPLRDAENHRNGKLVLNGVPHPWPFEAVDPAKNECSPSFWRSILRPTALFNYKL